MMGKVCCALVLAAVAIGWASSSLAEGALAVGLPGGDPSKGFRWSAKVNNPNAAAEAMESCRASRYPAIAAACVLITTFSDQCVAIAANAAPDVSVTGAGWAIAPDSASAKSRAIAQCNIMRKGTGQPCTLDNNGEALFCDGSAK